MGAVVAPFLGRPQVERGGFRVGEIVNVRAQVLGVGSDGTMTVQVVPFHPLTVPKAAVSPLCAEVGAER